MRTIPLHICLSCDSKSPTSTPSMRHTTDMIGQHFARFVRFSSLKLTFSLVVVEVQFGIMCKGTEVSVFVWITENTINSSFGLIYSCKPRPTNPSQITFSITHVTESDP